MVNWVKELEDAAGKTIHGAMFSDGYMFFAFTDGTGLAIEAVNPYGDDEPHCTVRTRPVPRIDDYDLPEAVEAGIITQQEADEQKAKTAAFKAAREKAEFERLKAKFKGNR